MSRYVALNRTEHRYAGLLPVSCIHALTQSAVPLVANELPQALATMVIAFVPASEGGGYQLAAIQSLRPGMNVYVHKNGRWLGGYKPAWYREHPFLLASDPNDKQKKVVCVDEQSEFFQRDPIEGVVSLFDEDGEVSEVTRHTMKFLEKLDQARMLTNMLVSQLVEAELIVPWELTTRTPNSEGGQVIHDLYHVDEERLRELSPEMASVLLKTGAMSLAFSQLVSEHRLKGLVRLHEIHAQATRSTASTEDVDLEALFADDDDDNLTF